MAAPDDEDHLLRSVALPNAHSILQARHRAEDALLRTQDALRESQERLTAALTAAGTGTLRWDLRTDMVEWDGNLGRIFGLETGQTPQSLSAFIDAVHPDDKPGVVEQCARCARDGADFDMEFRVVWPDASVHWIDEKAKAFFDGDGRPLYMTGACAEITTRKLAVEALRANEEQLRAMFNQAAVGIAVASLDGCFIDMNKKFSAILEYPVDALKGMTFSDITHPDDMAQTQSSVRQLLDGAIPEYSLEKRYLRKDGSTLWSLTTVTLLKSVDGAPLRFMGVIEDITARKQTEAALREETRILELLHATGRTLASELDLEALVQAVTDAAMALSGAQFGAFLRRAVTGTDDVLPRETVSGVSREAFQTLGTFPAEAVFGPPFRGDTPLRCDDVMNDRRDRTLSVHQGTPTGDLSVRSCLAVPVGSRSGDMIGGLFLGHERPAAFTDRSERLVVGLAAQAAVAIENARLYEAHGMPPKSGRRSSRVNAQPGPRPKG